MAVAIANRAAADPDGPALHDHMRTYSWRQVNDVLNRAVHRLLQADLGPERRVAVMGGNEAETTLVHTAGLLAGVSTVPVNPRLNVTETAHILRDSGAGALFTGAATIDAGLAAAAEAAVPQ